MARRPRPRGSLRQTTTPRLRRRRCVPAAQSRSRSTETRPVPRNDVSVRAQRMAATDMRRRRRCIRLVQAAPQRTHRLDRHGHQRSKQFNQVRATVHSTMAAPQFGAESCSDTLPDKALKVCRHRGTDLKRGGIYACVNATNLERIIHRETQRHFVKRGSCLHRSIVVDHGIALSIHHPGFNVPQPICSP